MRLPRYSYKYSVVEWSATESRKEADPVYSYYIHVWRRLTGSPPGRRPHRLPGPQTSTGNGRPRSRHFSCDTTRTIASLICLVGLILLAKGLLDFNTSSVNDGNDSITNSSNATSPAACPWKANITIQMLEMPTMAANATAKMLGNASCPVNANVRVSPDNDQGSDGIPPNMTAVFDQTASLNGSCPLFLDSTISPDDDQGSVGAPSNTSSIMNGTVFSNSCPLLSNTTFGPDDDQGSEGLPPNLTLSDGTCPYLGNITVSPDDDQGQDGNFDASISLNSSATAAPECPLKANITMEWLPNTTFAGDLSFTEPTVLRRKYTFTQQNYTVTQPPQTVFITPNITTPTITPVGNWTAPTLAPPSTAASYRSCSMASSEIQGWTGVELVSTTTAPAAERVWCACDGGATYALPTNAGAPACTPTPIPQPITVTPRGQWQVAETVSETVLQCAQAMTVTYSGLNGAISTSTDVSALRLLVVMVTTATDLLSSAPAQPRFCPRLLTLFSACWPPAVPVSLVHESVRRWRPCVFVSDDS